MRTLTLLALAFSAQAFACPDLTGAFTCTYQDGSSEIIQISQENKSGTFVYNYNGSTLPADNQTYPIPDDQSLRSATFRVWCDGAGQNQLMVQLLGKVYQDSDYVGDLTLNLALGLAGQDLHQVTSGAIVGPKGTSPLNNEITCKRN